MRHTRRKRKDPSIIVSKLPCKYYIHNVSRKGDQKLQE